MQGYLSKLIQNGARSVAPVRRAPMLAAARPPHVVAAVRPVPGARSLAAHAPAPQPALPARTAPQTPPPALVEPSRHASPVERTAPQQAESTPPRVGCAAPAVMGVAEPASGAFLLHHAPVEISSPVAAESAPPRVGTATSEVMGIAEPTSDAFPLRHAPVEISNPVAAEPQTLSIPEVKPRPIPVPRIEFSSSKAPVPDRRSLRPATLVTATPQPEPPRSPAPEPALSTRPVARAFSAAAPAARSPREQPLPLASPKPEAPLPTVRPEKSPPSPPLSVRSRDVGPAEISMREDFRHRQLPTRSTDEPCMIIQRLDVQIINDPAPVRHRPGTHSPATPHAESDLLCLGRRHVRRLL
jgi:hypothetical protein